MLAKPGGWLRLSVLEENQVYKQCITILYLGCIDDMRINDA